MPRRVRNLALIGCYLLVVCTSATPTAGARTPGEAKIQAFLTKSGAGMIVNSQWNPPTETWSWSICDAAGASCRPFAAGRNVEFPAAPAGSTFRATANDGPTALSPVWKGPLQQATAPSVTGAIDANGLVTPVPAAWSGGWAGDDVGRDGDFTQLAACATSDGRECTTLTNREFGGGCPHGATVLDPIFTGAYLRVASFVTGPDPIFAEVAYSTPYGKRVWQAGSTTAAAMLGKIAPASHPRREPCGPPPLDPRVSAREPIPVRYAYITKAGVGRVRCWQDPCQVLLIARHGRAIRAKRPMPERHDRLEVAIPPATVVLRGKVRYSLKVDGELLAQRVLGVR
jgi:hypothetical protein